MGLDIKYEVENIGNIKKATISIKPLTIIAGENSSGKTFITKSLYTILSSVYKNHFVEEILYKYQTFQHSYYAFLDDLSNPAKIDKKFEDNFDNFNYKVQDFIRDLEICKFEEQDEVVKIYTTIFKDFKENLNSYIKNRLKLQKFKKYHDTMKKIDSLYKELETVVLNRKEIVIDNIATHLENGFKKNFQITSLANLITKKQKKFKLSLSTIGDVSLNLEGVIDFSFHGLGIQKVQNVENIVFFDSPVYIKIRKSLQKQSFASHFEDRYLKGYPEYLDALYNFIDNEYIDTPCFDNISKEIEQLIQGKLKVSKSGEITYIDEDGSSIPLSLAAMGISNFGLIDLLIKNNTINKGSFLIMDEPEVHLHPKWQVALANVLYKIAKSGANVIIATHSLDLLKAFESILKTGTDNPENIIAINKMPYDKNFVEKTELEKVQIVLDDLSEPYYNLYLKDV